MSLLFWMSLDCMTKCSTPNARSLSDLVSFPLTLLSPLPFVPLNFIYLMMQDIGGGTPSIVSIENIERIMKAAHKHFDFDPNDMEVSLETTPRIAASDPQKLKAYLYCYLFICFLFFDTSQISQDGDTKDQSRSTNN